ncbi:MAG: hypothetical protein KA771_01280 [Spirochaetales bacterium]|nr:hypothetical protein [Spirochaetales bacterium]
MQPAWGVEQDTEGNANKAFDHLVEAYLERLCDRSFENLQNKEDKNSHSCFCNGVQTP